MNDELPDKTVLIIILATLLLVLITIFSFSSNRLEKDKLIEWRDSKITSTIIISRK